MSKHRQAKITCSWSDVWPVDQSRWCKFFFPQNNITCIPKLKSCLFLVSNDETLISRETRQRVVTYFWGVHLVEIIRNSKMCTRVVTKFWRWWIILYYIILPPFSKESGEQPSREASQDQENHVDGDFCLQLATFDSPGTHTCTMHEWKLLIYPTTTDQKF